MLCSTKCSTKYSSIVSGWHPTSIHRSVSSTMTVPLSCAIVIAPHSRQGPSSVSPLNSGFSHFEFFIGSILFLRLLLFAPHLRACSRGLLRACGALLRRHRCRRGRPAEFATLAPGFTEVVHHVFGKPFPFHDISLTPSCKIVLYKLDGVKLISL